MGRRFPTKEYTKYKKDLGFLVPKIKLPPPPYRIDYIVGFSNKASDLDNPIKQFQDFLATKQGFNDSLIYKITVEKKIVKKGEEYIEFKITTFET